MKKLKIILLTSLFLWGCTNLNNIVEQIAENNMLESEYIGFAGSKSDEYKRFKKLSKIASNSELEELSTHTHPIVRTYALQILLKRKLIESDEAFQMALKNNESFGTMSADLMGSSDVCTEVYYSVLNKYPRFDEDKMEHIIIQNNEVNKLDSLVLYEINDDHFLHYMALNDKKHTNKFNNRIIELALKQRVPSAVNYIEKNGIIVDTTEMINSIEFIIENKFIGSNPKEKMEKLLKKLKSN